MCFVFFVVMEPFEPTFFVFFDPWFLEKSETQDAKGGARRGHRMRTGATKDSKGGSGWGAKEGSIRKGISETEEQVKHTRKRDRIY